jgi:hypothetical protein
VLTSVDTELLDESLPILYSEAFYLFIYLFFFLVIFASRVAKTLIFNVFSLPDFPIYELEKKKNAFPKSFDLFQPRPIKNVI